MLETLITIFQQFVEVFITKITAIASANGPSTDFYKRKNNFLKTHFQNFPKSIIYYVKFIFGLLGCFLKFQTK